jgi:hypothetical protein
MPKSLIGNNKRTLIDVSVIRTQQQVFEYNKINLQKNELIQIMRDYLGQKVTRIITTDKLDKLNSKIA